LGLEPPDPELRCDKATGRWHHGPIDFDELKRVVNGDGPCNKRRLGERIKAHEDGAWVREALLAYNARHESPRREFSGAPA
jgi:ring-1,2-phenylacetyl-CoA epoxidase subunit PaaA